MPRQTTLTPEQTKVVLDDLFLHPPVNDADLHRRLTRVDMAHARRLLSTRLSDGMVSDGDSVLFFAAFLYLGIGEEEQRLLQIAKDDSHSHRDRAYALAVLARDDPRQFDLLMQLLPPDDAHQIAHIPLYDLLTAIQHEPALAESLATTLVSMPAPLRRQVLDDIEDCRKQVDTPASLAYSHALEQQELRALYPMMLEAITAETSADSITLLERLRDQSTDDKTRRQFQRALMQIRTRAIDINRPYEGRSGVAYLGSCDGQGAFILLGCFDNNEGTVSTADICIRAAADIRDGFVLPRQSREDVTQTMNILINESGSGFVEITLPEAAEIVHDAVIRTQELGRSIPEDAVASVAMFERTRLPEGVLLPVALPLPEMPTVATVRKLLRRSIYVDSWFFDEGDLSAAGFTGKIPSRASRKWVKETAERLNSPALVQRLSGMASHMAHWHSWRGEHTEAAIFASLAQITAENFVEHPLVHVLIQRATTHVDSTDNDATPFGDAHLRHFLKRTFFADIEQPKGRDLARLDFTEAALASLDRAFDLLSGEKRPRDDQRNRVAFALGQIYADYLVRTKHGGNAGVDVDGVDDPELVPPVVAMMIPPLSTICNLDFADAALVGGLVAKFLDQFCQQICMQCPVGCWKRPRSNVADAFFSSSHPVLPHAHNSNG
ncbi:MAG: hypothetical protein HUU55_19360 [Myxococcales bacterium]|nr:hypothetical protein [Myxococcales bacterium]